MANAEKKPPVDEIAALFDKTHTCPVCDTEFKCKKVRTGKLRSDGTDTDLRPRYHGIDSLKYDAVVCPECGYASLERFFGNISPYERKQIQEKITPDFTGMPITDQYYTYNDALERHKQALKVALVRNASNGEQAYTCLKMAWICRGMAEEMQADGEDPKKIKALKVQELKLMAKACSGFEVAFSKEEFPICGMDELTLSYLLAELSRRVGKLDAAGRWISHVLVSKQASNRLKDKARDIKEMIAKDLEKANKQ